MTPHDDLIAGVRWLRSDLDDRPDVGRSAQRRAPADVYVTDDPQAVVIEIDAAGVHPEDVDIELDGDMLRIRGKRRLPVGQRRVYHHAEIDWGPFERRIRLGVEVDGEHASARYDLGILVITLPLSTQPSRVRMAITIRDNR